VNHPWMILATNWREIWIWLACSILTWTGGLTVTDRYAWGHCHHIPISRFILMKHGQVDIDHKSPNIAAIWIKRVRRCAVPKPDSTSWHTHRYRLPSFMRQYPSSCLSAQSVGSLNVHSRGQKLKHFSADMQYSGGRRDVRYADIPEEMAAMLLLSSSLLSWLLSPPWCNPWSRHQWWSAWE
jgi:hypothetical protein